MKTITLHGRYIANLRHMTVDEAADLVSEAFKSNGQSRTRVEVTNRAQRVLDHCHRILREGCKRAGVQFSWEDPEKSLLEAVLSRGDRRVADVVETAWRNGAKFDSWS